MMKRTTNMLYITMENWKAVISAMVKEPICVKVCLNGPDTGNDARASAISLQQLLRPFKLHMAPALTGGTGSPDLVIR